MLSSIHVKNLALIDEIEVEFKKGLNILTGETGAGKSIIIESINVALGKKAAKDMIRKGADYALIELIFIVDDVNVLERVRALDITVEDDMLIISRRIMSGRSVSRINGEVVSLKDLKEIAALLIDIHGQHEHQSLLYKSNHLNILDQFAKDKLEEKKIQMQQHYEAYKKVKEQLDAAITDEEQRKRQISFLEFEINEITDAKLVKNEDEELDIQYKKMSNSQQIMQNLHAVHAVTGGDGASEMIGHGLRQFYGIEGYDEALTGFRQELETVDNLLNDFNRELSDYMSDLSFDDETFFEIENRLNTVNSLKVKYGQSIDAILDYCQEKQTELDKLLNYEEYLDDLRRKLSIEEKKLKKISEEVSNVRKEESRPLVEQIRQSLLDLNFLDVRFDMVFEALPDYTKNGLDSCEFMIATNPGEDLKPLGQVASGGELSRVMLAIKSVLAQSDQIDSLIFDEIDAGISGRTAQMVSRQLSMIARNHQILCITHLPQIAAMADEHFVIEKSVEDNRTQTKIYPLTEDEMVQEISRLLGGVEITETTVKSAIEMKNLAANTKKY